MPEALDSVISRQPLWKSLWAAAALAIILLSTRAIELGDTLVYSNDIVEHLGKSPFGKGNSLWEFGHLLWRPLGWASLSVMSPLLSALTGWTAFMQASFVLIAISTACALVTVVLWHAIAFRASGSRSVAFLIAVTMAFTHAFLLYSHSGCAYIPGVTSLTASLYFLLARRAIAGAVSYALAILLWFPFILGGLALFLLAAAPYDHLNTPLREQFRRFSWINAARFAIVSGIVVLLVYGFALYASGISSPAEAKAWYSSASHGYSQNSRLLRVATGLPRSFLYLGKDGILYKRFLRHDPYAPVSLRDIAGASLWKLAAFDLFVLCLLYELLRRPFSGWLLLLTAAGTVPVVFFAVVIFEPGSPERYLPALPFLVLATASVLRDLPVRRRVTQLIIAAFLICVVLTNGYSFAAPRISAENTTSLSRVADLRTRIAGAGVVMLTTNQDALEEAVNRLAFSDINRPAPLPVYDIVEPANIRVLTWQRDFARRTLQEWRRGGDVWVSRRVWSPRPLPSWNWVEGDDPRIAWTALPRFFATLNTDAESGGPDGFLRIARNDANLDLLTRYAR